MGGIFVYRKIRTARKKDGKEDLGLKKLSLFLGLFVTGFVALGGCKKNNEVSMTDSQENKSTANEPDRIKVQHILIAFKGTIPGQERSKEDAEKLAKDIFEKAKAPNSNFEALVKEFSNDRPPGIYEMTNRGISNSGSAFARDQMVPAFGDIGFKLGVGDVGIANFDPQTSPFGWHIIKRLN